MAGKGDVSRHPAPDDFVSGDSDFHAGGEGGGLDFVVPLNVRLLHGVLYGGDFGGRDARNSGDDLRFSEQEPAAFDSRCALLPAQPVVCGDLFDD